jgi:hypothetical protein
MYLIIELIFFPPNINVLIFTNFNDTKIFSLEQWLIHYVPKNLTQVLHMVKICLKGDGVHPITAVEADNSCRENL